MQRLSVTGIKATAYHGCIEEEARVGGVFTVDAHFYGDFSKAFETDDLSYAVDYVSVSRIVHELLQKREKLIETVAHNMLLALKEAFPQCDAVELTITKHRAPIEMPVESVSFTIKG